MSAETHTQFSCIVALLCRTGQALLAIKQIPFAVQAFRWGVMQDPHHEDMWLELAKALRKMVSEAGTGSMPRPCDSCTGALTGLGLLGEVEHVFKKLTHHR